MPQRSTLILTYGGTVEALPLYIISFTTLARDTDYVVTADSFIVVPQTDGIQRQIRQPDPIVEAGVTELLVAAGGAPL